ncbi:hypothetical protein CPB85DRAFT_1548472 [Mucidula mucida]|nr:hypothetical protein CPB85DRAFT_1548472 [Mucidula mucida]
MGLLVSTAAIAYKILPSHRFSISEEIFPLLLPDRTFDHPGCPQVPALYPETHAGLDATLNHLFSTDGFKLEAYKQLGGAVRIQTESYDDLLPVGQDDRWNVFQDFHQYLETSFPVIYQKLDVKVINTYGLVFHWQGSDQSLKPILFAAHQDVVPVDPITIGQWSHPPYSGHFDGTWIWGRGSADDKADLISQMIMVDQLLKKDFTPRRTIVLAFGIDEEASGIEGEGYGKNAEDSIILAVPGIAEKGYLDVRVEVSSAGGHSSVPPDHTTIGLLSMLVVELEKNTQRPVLQRSGTGFANAQCSVLYDTRYPPALRALAKKALHSDQALEHFMRALISFDKLFGVLFKTTQAVDLINGGVKINALPEVAAAVVNHRIGEHSSSKEVQQHITELVVPIGQEFNLTISAFGDHLTLPSPVSPIHLKGPYGVLSGTIKATLQSSSRYKASGVVVSPSLGLGNTDTRFYWNLTRHIYRYSHRGDLDDLYNGLHTVNEGESFIEQIRFFTKLVLNLDESKDL